jgi:amino acid adenylation domain-containing protein
LVSPESVDDPSSGEQALWLLQRLVPDRGVSNMAVAVAAGRVFQWWPLQEALTWLVRRHAALRTSYSAPEGVLRRSCRDADTVELALDIVASDPSTLDADLREYSAAPFDTERAPLLRVGLFTVDKRHVLVVVAHHIIVDHVSLRRLVLDLATAYESFATLGTAPEVADLAPVPAAESSTESLAYWRAHLAGFDPAGMRLSGAGVPRDWPTFEGDTVEVELDAGAERNLAALRREHRTTSAIVLLAVYFMALRRHGADPDSLVGVVANTREDRSTNAVGYHVATMPVRAYLPDEVTFTDVVAEVNRLVFTGMERGVVPFEVLTTDDRAGEGPDWWRTRMVRHLFNYRVDTGTSQWQDASIRAVCTGLSRFDLELTVEQHAGGVRLRLLFAKEIHDDATARRLLGWFAPILRQAVDHPDQTLSAFELRTDEDRRLVGRTNETVVAWSGPRTVPGMMAATALGAAPAVANGDVVTSYDQLVAAAWEVYEQVRGHGGERRPVVGIAAPRSAGTAAAVLGIWAAGASYLPLDPMHPVQRLGYQLDDAGCDLVFGVGPRPAWIGDRTWLTVPDPATPRNPPAPLPEPAADDPAYLIFTSGSTGRPKGVVLSHLNLANVVRHFANRLKVDHTGSMLWLTTFAFDISALELCLPLSVGGRVVVAADEAKYDPDELLHLISEHDVSVIQATPTTWRLVAGTMAGELGGRTVLCGGEPLRPALAAELLATGARVLNVYGPTETTIWSTASELTVDDTSVTIGAPIDNTSVHVLDDHGNELPVGLDGELCVAGTGVAVGYHGRPELTAERFRYHPEIGRYYRTGDRARWLPDGRLELLGRDDRQVKLRAHRIELGEVESVLVEHPEVRAAAVVVAGEPVADAQLVAFVQGDHATGLADRIWAYAATRLPLYSLPAGIHVLESFPTTPNGKVDTVALVDLATKGAAASGGDPADVSSEQPFEARLVDLWREVLNRPRLDRRSNFFLSGGHSLLAIRLAAAVSATLGREVTMAMVFRAPTPAALARLLTDRPTT